MAAIDLPRGWTWEGVPARLGEHVDLEESAREHKPAPGPTRERLCAGAWSGAERSCLRLAYVLGGLSLRGTEAWAEAAGQAPFSDVTLLKRLRRSGPWLAELAGQPAVVANPAAGDGRWRGRG